MKIIRKNNRAVHYSFYLSVEGVYVTGRTSGVTLRQRQRNLLAETFRINLHFTEFQYFLHCVQWLSKVKLSLRRPRRNTGQRTYSFKQSKDLHLTEACRHRPYTFGCFIAGVRGRVNPSNAKLNPICHLLALVGTRHILHVSRVRVKH